MFSHMVVGSNDLDRSKHFYDALFGKEAKRDEKGRLSYGRRGTVFMVTPPIDGAPATNGNGSTIGFIFDSPEAAELGEVDRSRAIALLIGPLVLGRLSTLADFDYRECALAAVDGFLHVQTSRASAANIESAGA